MTRRGRARTLGIGVLTATAGLLGPAVATVGAQLTIEQMAISPNPASAGTAVHFTNATDAGRCVTSTGAPGYAHMYIWNPGRGPGVNVDHTVTAQANASGDFDVSFTPALVGQYTVYGECGSTSVPGEPGSELIHEYAQQTFQVNEPPPTTTTTTTTTTVPTITNPPLRQELFGISPSPGAVGSPVQFVNANESGRCITSTGAPGYAHLYIWNPGRGPGVNVDHTVTAPADANGDFQASFTPDQTGEYTVYGECGSTSQPGEPGSELVHEYQQTTFRVDQPPPTTVTITQPPTTVATTTPGDFVPPATPPADAQPLDLSYVRQGDSLAERFARLRELFRVYDTGFAPNEEVNVVLYSDPVILATTRADDTGTVDVMVQIPAHTALGEHTLVLFGAGLAKAATITIEGEAPSAPATTISPRVETLPATGTGLPITTAVVGLGLLVTGVLTLGISRSRTSAVPKV